MDTHRDWIQKIVDKHWDQDEMIRELAAEVTVLAAEAYDEGLSHGREEGLGLDA